CACSGARSTTSGSTTTATRRASGSWWRNVTSRISRRIPPPRPPPAGSRLPLHRAPGTLPTSGRLLERGDEPAREHLLGRAGRRTFDHVLARGLQRGAPERDLRPRARDDRGDRARTVRARGRRLPVRARRTAASFGRGAAHLSG